LIKYLFSAKRVSKFRVYSLRFYAGVYLLENTPSPWGGGVEEKKRENVKEKGRKGKKKGRRGKE
jgi:hypothetical protein